MTPIRFFNRAKPSLHTVCIITARVHPRDHGRSGMEKLPCHDYFVTATWFECARARGRRAAASDDNPKQRNEQKVTGPAKWTRRDFQQRNHLNICPWF